MWVKTMVKQCRKSPMTGNGNMVTIPPKKPRGPARRARACRSRPDKPCRPWALPSWRAWWSLRLGHNMQVLKMEGAKKLGKWPRKNSGFIVNSWFMIV